MWLLGTAHLSRRSAADVRRLVEAVQPDSVVVELCRWVGGAVTGGGMRAVVGAGWSP